MHFYNIKNDYDEDQLMAYLTGQFQTRFHKDLEIFNSKSRISVTKVKQGISAILAEFLNVEEHFQVRLKLTPVIKSLDGLIDAHKRYIISEKANFFSMDYQKRNRDDMQQIDDVLKRVKGCLDKLAIDDNRLLLLESISDLMNNQYKENIPAQVKRSRRRSSSSNSTESLSNKQEEKEDLAGIDNLLNIQIGDLDFLNDNNPQAAAIPLQQVNEDAFLNDLFNDLDSHNGASGNTKETLGAGVGDNFHNDFLDDSFDRLFNEILQK